MKGNTFTGHSWRLSSMVAASLSLFSNLVFYFSKQYYLPCTNSSVPHIVVYCTKHCQDYILPLCFRVLYYTVIIFEHFFFIFVWTKPSLLNIWFFFDPFETTAAVLPWFLLFNSLTECREKINSWRGERDCSQPCLWKGERTLICMYIYSLLYVWWSYFS